VKPDRGWKRWFEDPIPLPCGRQTLQDAADHILKLSKSEQNLGKWQAATEASAAFKDLLPTREKVARFRTFVVVEGVPQQPDGSLQIKAAIVGDLFSLRGALMRTELGHLISRTAACPVPRPNQ
jgi:hypothetical protein